MELLCMSPLQINLSSKEIATAYQSVLDGSDIDWMLLTYDKGSNDLKIGGALSSSNQPVVDFEFVPRYNPNVLNWCGDGVPEVKKGLFRTLTSSSVICILNSCSQAPIQA
ncbi:hypothetical protein JB92DRAFT_2984362, partial [Gautieria morchelliformis]